MLARIAKRTGLIARDLCNECVTIACIEHRGKAKAGSQPSGRGVDDSDRMEGCLDNLTVGGKVSSWQPSRKKSLHKRFPLPGMEHLSVARRSLESVELEASAEGERAGKEEIVRRIEKSTRVQPVVVPGRDQEGLEFSIPAVRAILLHEAETEFWACAAYRGQLEPGLGVRFKLEVDQFIGKIVADPMRPGLRRKCYRRVNLLIFRQP